jgi:hypothetical protein
MSTASGEGPYSGPGYAPNHSSAAEPDPTEGSPIDEPSIIPEVIKGAAEFLHSKATGFAAPVLAAPMQMLMKFVGLEEPHTAQQEHPEGEEDEDGIPG